MSDPVVYVPDMCQYHQARLVRHAGYGPEDAWRALIIMVQVALFQGVTADPKIHERIGVDITRLKDVGCLACLKPTLFNELVEVAKNKEDMGAIKRLGESWLNAAS